MGNSCTAILITLTTLVAEPGLTAGGPNLNRSYYSRLRAPGPDCRGAVPFIRSGSHGLPAA
jgi:hypothetical protein